MFENTLKVCSTVLKKPFSSLQRFEPLLSSFQSEVLPLGHVPGRWCIILLAFSSFSSEWTSQGFKKGKHHVYLYWYSIKITSVSSQWEQSAKQVAAAFQTKQEKWLFCGGSGYFLHLPILILPSLVEGPWYPVTKICS